VVNNPFLNWDGNEFSEDPQYGVRGPATSGTRASSSSSSRSSSTRRSSPTGWSPDAVPRGFTLLSPGRQAADGGRTPASGHSRIKDNSLDVYVAVLGDAGCAVKAPVGTRGHHCSESVLLTGARVLHERLVEAAGHSRICYLVLAPSAQSFLRGARRNKKDFDGVRRGYDASVRDHMLDVVRGLPRWRVIVALPRRSTWSSGKQWAAARFDSEAGQWTSWAVAAGAPKDYN